MKIGQETVEIKPINIENLSGIKKWKSGVNITRIEQLIEGLSFDSRQKSIIDLENVCNKIIEGNDFGLQKVCESRGQSTDNIYKYIADLFDKIKLGDDDSVEKIKDFIFDYKLYYLEKYEKAMSYIEEAKIDFMNMIEQTSKQYGTHIDIEKARLIIDKTSISLVDGSYFGKVFNTTGAKHSTSGELYLGMDSFSSKETFRYAFFHELLHVISTDYSKIIHIEPRNNPIDTQATGVDFSGNFENRKRGFVWLNEPFTDVFAASMANVENNGDSIKPRYGIETKLIRLLGEKGNINIFQKMYGVYFRHIKKDNEVSGVDEWRNFSKEIDNVFGPRFLVTLDIFIEKNGIEKAIEVIEKWETGKMNIDDLK